jgi:hypothetical protein
VTVTVLAGGQVIGVVGGGIPVLLPPGGVETGDGIDPPPDLEQLAPEPAGLAAAQLQRAADWTWLAVGIPQRDITQFCALAWMAAVFEHWQAKSVAPQPRAEPSERRQDC